MVSPRVAVLLTIGLGGCAAAQLREDACHQRARDIEFVEQTHYMNYGRAPSKTLCPGDKIEL